MAQKSFIEILENQIRKDLRKEIEAEVRAQVETEVSVETPRAASRPSPHTTTAFWQMSTPRHKTTTSAKSAYGAPKAFTTPLKSAPKSEQLQAVAVSAAEILALELLQRNAGRSATVGLGSSTSARSLTHAELKTLWRTAALRTHPDRFAQADLAVQTQAATLFRELTTAYEILATLFETPRARAA